jgi:hypothetical protein
MSVTVMPRTTSQSPFNVWGGNKVRNAQVFAIVTKRSKDLIGRQTPSPELEAWDTSRQGQTVFVAQLGDCRVRIASD